MAVKILHFITIMLYVLVAGVMWGTWLALARTMTRYDAATFLTDGHHMIENLALPMTILMIGAVLAGLVSSFVMLRQGPATAGWPAVAGCVLMIGVLVVTLAVEVPLDNDINRWTVATLPADWQDQRARWANFHTLRTFLSLLAVAAAVAAALGPRRAPSGRAAVPVTTDAQR